MLENGVWMSAEHLGAGYRIVNSDGSVSVVEGIELVRYNEGKAIYNLNVEDNHTYFVSQDKVCVHNDCMVTAEGIERVFNAIPKGTPSSEIRNMVNENVELPMDDFALPGLKIKSALEADHIVPMKNIVKMDGFDKLTY